MAEEALAKAKEAIEIADEKLARTQIEVDSARTVYDLAVQMYNQVSAEYRAAIKKYVNEVKTIGETLQYEKLISTGICMLNISYRNPHIIKSKFIKPTGIIQHLGKKVTVKTHYIKYRLIRTPEGEFVPDIPTKDTFCEECNVVQHSYNKTYTFDYKFKPSKFSQQYIYDNVFMPEFIVDKHLVAGMHLVNSCSYALYGDAGGPYMIVMVAELPPATE